MAGVGETVTPATLTIGGVQAVVLYSGLAPGLAGLYQVDALVPASAPGANSIPVVISVGGVNSNTVAMVAQ